MSYAPPVISSGGATAGQGPSGSEFVAPAAAFTGVGMVAPGAAYQNDQVVATAATIELPPQPQAPAAPAPPPQPQQEAPAEGGGEAQAAPPTGISPVLRRKALLVACNYRGTSAELKGCGNDQQCMAYCLKNRFGFRDDEMLLLFDGQGDPRLWPTRANMIAAMRWLVDGAKAGDSLFFHYSGHGCQTTDWSGDEADGYNETLCPCDFRNGGGMIVDDELNSILVNSLPAGAVLTVVCDACHSGSVLDLEFRTEFNSATGQAVWQQEYTRRPSRPKGTSGGIALAFSAARDGQVAADTAALSGTVSTGAATYAFISAVEKVGAQVSVGRLLHEMHRILSHSIGTADGDGQGAASAAPAMPSLGGLLGALLGVGSLGVGRGQNPVLTASSAIDLNSPLRL